ncbi:hypothetical protein AAFG07_31010 [Bradyrhizobium sp. B097]|uniref:hypothetical protein n=1 Tax=Bradyrhizobium sp. B097 TaxID=3140244 RepID=UPI0031843EBA
MRQRKQFETRGEANDFRIETESQLRTGTYRPEADKVLVAELAEVFLDHCRARMERGERMTRRNFQVYEGYVRNYICPNADWHAQKHTKPHHQFQAFEKGLGLRKLSQLTVGMVTKFRDDLREAGLSVATTRKIIAMLQVMLAYGISLDLIAVNAAEGVRVIGRRGDTRVFRRTAINSRGSAFEQRYRLDGGLSSVFLQDNFILAISRRRDPVRR